MSLPFECSWCGASFGVRADRAQHEADHERQERRDWEADGAAARLAGRPVEDCPHPARTWPAIEWRRGWLAARMTEAA